MKPGLFHDGVWQSHVHWMKTGHKRGYWQCRLVRSRGDGRYKGVAHLSNARGYVQFTQHYGVRYRFVLSTEQAARRLWGIYAVPWEYRSGVGTILGQRSLPEIGEMFMAYLSAERLCGRWGVADNLEWTRPHVVKPCDACPAPIIYRLKQRGVQGLSWPRERFKVGYSKSQQLEMFL